MTYMVELRYIGGDLADLMRDMRTWLDHNQIETREFHHSFGPPGLAFRVGFNDRDHATAFAEAFDGLLTLKEWGRIGRPRLAKQAADFSTKTSTFRAGSALTE